MSGPVAAGAEVIEAGAGAVGIELGSTRIKAVLVAPDGTPLASGAFAWQNRLRDGIWTYELAEVWHGLASAYAALGDDAERRHGVTLRGVAALGISAMMHGYLALGGDGRLLAPFRTWRNNITSEACDELGPILDFAVPQRWSIAHLYQCVLDDEPHLARLVHVKTLATYVHWRLTGRHIAGIDEAAGMFPVDAEAGAWDLARVAAFDDLVADRDYRWSLRTVLPEIHQAGTPAGELTDEGARLLDPSGRLPPGVPLCPPAGDAGTGMVATNSIRPRSANVSAGTSVFAMVVLDRPLARVHPEIDIVATPDGRPVAMVHANNGLSDLDAWMALFGEVAESLGMEPEPGELYRRLLPLALDGAPDGGAATVVNYLSGEHITGFAEGRPLLLRDPGAPLRLADLLRAMLASSLCALRSGMDILTEEEGVVVDLLHGHGGLFTDGEVGQRMLAAALEVPVAIPPMAGEGGAWGMAVLAAYLAAGDGRTLQEFIDLAGRSAELPASSRASVAPRPSEVEGFNRYYRRHQRVLAVERAAVDALADPASEPDSEPGSAR
jgi:sugar (pentulose or hexulose) kinase